MVAKNSIFNSVLIVGCVIILISFAIRSSFGVFQIPIAEEFNWLRSEFSLAIALQNLAWGIGQPIFSAIAEKIGDRRAIILGGFTYAFGLLLSSAAVTPQAHQFYEILVGFGVAGTGFGVILAVVGRASSEKNRSMSLAIATASGSAGQVLGAPIGELLLNYMPWQSVFLIFSITILSTLLLLPFMRVSVANTPRDVTQSMRELVGKAVVDPSYSMIFLGFFSCGYQLGFLTAHFPAFVTEMCNPILPTTAIYNLGITSTSALGAISISLIGLANIAGTLGAGYLGKTYSKKYLLSSIYLGRTMVCTVFILAPITPISVVLFSLLMGSLWLATVPLTSGLIAQIYGLRYMGTLYGIVFFSHQLGGFMGIWLGGRLYDVYGNYNLVWWIGIAVGAFSALVHLPIREQQKSWV
ncbi:MAG: MFS transporter [Rhodobacteraceae bacterium]|jgi:MFS family permease|nr:MFS transporter [Paracoccaceae bacterium]